MNDFFNDNANLSDASQFEDLTQSQIDSNQHSVHQYSDSGLPDSGQLNMLHQEPFSTELDLGQSYPDFSQAKMPDFNPHNGIEPSLISGYEEQTTLNHPHTDYSLVKSTQSDYQHQTSGYEDYSNHAEVSEDSLGQNNYDDLMDERTVRFGSATTVYHVHYWQKPLPYYSGSGDGNNYHDNPIPDSTDGGCVDSNGDGVCDSSDGND